MRWLPLMLVVGCSSGAAEAPESEGVEGSGAQEGGAKAGPVTVVEVGAVSRGSVDDEVGASAVVESEAHAALVPETVGIVVEIRADEGDAVVAGDILAVLDNVSLGTGAERALQEVRRLEAEVRSAQALASRGAISSKELSDLEFQLRTARLSSTEATSTFGQTRLTAPFDGVIAARNVSVGELATSGVAAFELVDPTRLRVVAALPERDLERVAIGQLARLLSAYDAENWTTGRVVRVAPVVDPTSGTFRVTIALDAGGRLRPGQFVSVRLVVDRHEDVLVVPNEAVVWEDGSPVVYRVVPAPPPDPSTAEPEEEGTFGWLAGWFGSGDDEDDPTKDAAAEETAPKLVAARTPIGLGLVDDTHAEIETGLTEGASIITVGQTHLRDGARVRTAAAATETAGVEATKDAG